MSTAADTGTAEAARAAALRRYGSDDVPPEQELAGLVRVAAVVTGVPTATLNLLHTTVQRNYATHGFEGGTCDLEDSLCGHALRADGRLHVPDASADPAMADSPWVDGRLDDIRLYASSPLRTPDGYMIGTLCVFDTRPRALDDLQLQALDDLAAQAMALLERRRLARRAEEATRAKSEFLAAVSHEIRTPMNGVLGMLDLVLAEPLSETARAHVEVAQRSAASLLGLLDDVLHLAKGEAGSTVLRPRPFDPARLVTDVGDALRVLAQRKGLDLVTRITGTVPSAVHGDPDRIRQVLVNLVGNAVKFSGEGHVELLLHGGTTGSSAELAFTVRDTGEGIPAEELPTLFTAFAQGRSGHRHGGTGLGLAICAQLADLMAGRLEVSSVLGAGSAFTLTVALPLAEPSDAVDADAPGAGLRVLVADDSEINQLVAAGLLRSLGADAETVADGEAAVAGASTGAYDVVLLDHEMPGLDGPAAARAIRALDGPAARTPLYALTGRVGEDDRRACLEAGMDGLLPKPLDPDLLAALLAHVRSSPSGDVPTPTG